MGGPSPLHTQPPLPQAWAGCGGHVVQPRPLIMFSALSPHAPLNLMHVSCLLGQVCSLEITPGRAALSQALCVPGQRWGPSREAGLAMWSSCLCSLTLLARLCLFFVFGTKSQARQAGHSWNEVLTPRPAQDHSGLI